MAEEPRKRQRPPQEKGESPAGRSPTLADRFRRGLSPNQVKICVAAIALLLVVILSILIFAVACTPADVASSTTSWSAPSSVSASVPEDDSFDRDAFSRVVGEYAGVLLDETEDAGATYVEETLFLGDSNTARMVTSSVDEVTMSNAIGIESMGITSVLGLKCVRFSGLSDMTMPSAVAVMQPKRVVINFGTNNAGMNTEAFIKSYRSAIEGIQSAWPYADIFIASVFPISQGCTYGGIKMSHIEEFNIALLNLAKDMDLRFLNWSDALKDPATGYCQSQYMTKDGVHLADAGIEAVFEYFRTHSYEGEDTRPQPLKAIPKRLATPEGLFPKPSPSPSASKSSSSSSSGSSSAGAVTVPSYDNAAGWNVVYNTVNNDGSYTEGQVLGQSPAAGTQVDAVGIITVSVAGPPPAATPPPAEPTPPPAEPTPPPVVESTPQEQPPATEPPAEGG